MTNHSDRYYRSAGAVPFGGILLMVALGSLAAVICGALYAAADWYIAYDIIPFLCAPAAGAGIGAAVKWGAMLGKVRHRGFQALVGLALGVVGAYVAWVFFIRLWDQAGFWLWDPEHLLLAINDISELGVWDNQPTGLWLKLIYGVEALAIMASSAAVASMETRPYCDPCNAWTKQIPETATLKLTDPEALRENLEESRYESLDELLDSAVDPANCLHAKVFKCPTCDESNYLTVSHFTRVEKGGETHQNEERFVNYLWVPPEVVAQVQHLASACEQSHVAEDHEVAMAGNDADDSSEG